MRLPQSHVTSHFLLQTWKPTAHDHDAYQRPDKTQLSSFKVPFPENCHYLNCLVVLLKNWLRRLLFIWHDSEFAQYEVFFLGMFVGNNWQQLLTITATRSKNNKRAKNRLTKNLNEKPWNMIYIHTYIGPLKSSNILLKIQKRPWVCKRLWTCQGLCVCSGRAWGSPKLSSRTDPETLCKQKVKTKVEL